MLDSFRAEFPGAAAWVARWRKPAIARETVGWAFLSAVGAGFIAQGVALVALMWIVPALFPATEPHPEWVTPAAIANLAGRFASGAVALRAGGIPAVAAYVAYEVLLLSAALPGRALFCERSGGAPGHPPVGGPVRACDLTSLVTDQWLFWLAIAVGMLAAGLLSARPGDGNRLLRAAGAFVVIGTVFGNAQGLLVTATGGTASPTLVSVSFLVIEAAAGIAAGLLLARSRLSGAVLLALLILAPTLAVALPLAVREGFPTEPLEFTFAKWQGVLIPALAAAGLLASRAYARAKGTIS